ncbi:MAG TPA: alpha-amylase [Candidatus Aenigmarchaeota archaeon]|nr:MAG: alpha-amylase [Candidatus Aenigmarchaeota archaeon]HDD45894.1 alpha-amylase [Candidatus Aenigmarchaeota archaeon]
MPLVNLVFEVHQPIRLRKYGVDRKSKNMFERYFSDSFNKEVFDRVANKCYYPATNTLLDIVNDLKNTRKPLKVAFSITGLWIEQAMKWHPDLIELFKQFPKKHVEFISETYYHSLASLFDDMGEWEDQVKEHRALITSLFNQKPKTITNTELIYNNVIARHAEKLGYKGIFTEGVERILGWRSPNYLYRPPNGNIKILLRNRRLTDDIGYRFSSRWWSEWPLTAEKYAAWLSACDGQVINLFMDYETFGEHHEEGSGIFWFLKALPYKINEYENLTFSLPREVIEKNDAVGVFDVFELSTISWADMEMDVSAWLGNDVQLAFHNELKRLGELVKRAKDKELLRIWRLLQTSDHLHNICTKWWGDGDVHQYFSYFDHPHQGFATIADVLFDFKEIVMDSIGRKQKKN